MLIRLLDWLLDASLWFDDRRDGYASRLTLAIYNTIVERSRA